ncbi:MAG: CpaF family protein [Actinomycetota bacterium]|nr:CpaF family protein [Actinomycetota bacterium]
MANLSRLLEEARRTNGNGATRSVEPGIWEGGSKATRPELYAVRRRIHAQLAKELGSVLYQQDLDPDRLKELVREKTAFLLRDEQAPMSADERQRLLGDIESDVLGHGPIEELMQDPDITEVMVNGPDGVFIEREGRIYKTNRGFADVAHLRSVIDGIVARVGRRIDESSPMVDARMPDGSRVNAVIHPVAVGGPFLTVRKFSKEPFTDQDLIAFGTMTDPVARFLETCVRGKLNMLISGGTGAGKTSTLNVISSYIPVDERIVTVEDAVELRLSQPHVLQLESRPQNIEGRGEITIRDLVRNALRMRPDRIVVGEVRGQEALDMLQAMNTGHEGSISTLHANSPRDGLSRLETMVLMAGMDLPIRAIREQISSAIDVVVHQSRLKDGSRRITHVSEVEGMEGDVITLQDIFTFDYSLGFDDRGRSRGALKPTGLRPKFTSKLADQGIEVSRAMFLDDDVLASSRPKATHT